MRAVRWDNASVSGQSFGGEAAITLANPAFAAEVERLSGGRITASSSPAAPVVILTEGLADGDLIARHWQTLAAARAARAPGRNLVLLQESRPDTGLEGLARTLRREWPDVSVACWTLPKGRPAEVAGRLADSLTVLDHDLWFGADGRSLTAVLGPSISPRRIQTSAADGTWLITGGARGVTAACATGLAARAGGTFLLAGRSLQTPWPEGIAETTDLKTLRGLLAAAALRRGEKPSPVKLDKVAREAIAGLEIRRTLAEIEAAGARAHYIQMDTANATSVGAALAAIRQSFPPVTGLVHGAGVIADRLADDKTEAELSRVFGPKAEGLFHLLAGLDRTALRHVGLFSSASAFFGNRGQSDYAMANAVLANAGRALAAELPGVRVKVFDWGPWDGGMVDTTLASHFREQGVALIPLEEGARIFVHELLAGDPSEVELVVGTMWSDR